jgi:hypothetical protein
VKEREMAEKTFCDVCNGEILNPLYTVSIFDSQKDDNILHKDLCPLCMEATKRAIESVVNPL